jgi:hypothetical protein
MFIIEETKIDRAIDRAKELHPKVRMIEFGTYAVSGSKGTEYMVKCFRAAGQKVVACTCKTRNGTACKHGVAALLLHIHMAARRRAASH